MSIGTPTVQGSPYLSNANALDTNVTSDGTGLHVRIPSNVPAGDAVILHMGANGVAAGTITGTDSQSNPYTLVGTATNASAPATTTGGLLSIIGTALTGGTDHADVAHTTNAGSLTGHAIYVGGTSGLDGGSSPVAQSGTTSGLIATMASGIVVPSTSDLLVILGDTSNGVTAITANPSPGGNPTIGSGLTLGYIHTTTGATLRSTFGMWGTGLSGTITPTWQVNSNQAYSVLMFVLKPTPTGGWVLGSAQF